MTPEARIGLNIRRIRRAADLTQERVSLDAEISRPSMTLYERGHRLPRLDVLLKLASVLEVETEVLLDGVRWEPATTGKRGRWVIEEAR
jgi:transcriptional regulator with XRE-family HTH domain